MTKGVNIGRRSLQYKWVIFGVLAAQYLFGYFHRVCPAVVAPELTKAFDISGMALGVLASAYFYPYAAMQIPAGILADSWGPKKTVMVCALIAALGSVFFGLSPTLGYAIFSRVLVGFGVSAMFVTSLKIFANWFKPTEFARMSALFMAAGGVGWLTAATPLAVFSQYFDWRWAFIGLGIITMLLTVLTRFTVSDRPDESDAEAASERGKSPGSGVRKIGQDLRMVLKEKHFWPLAAWMFLVGTGSFGFFSLWAGPYLMDAYRLSKPAAGNVLSVLPLAMVFAGPFLGYLSDRVLVSRKKVLVVASVVYVVCWFIMLLHYDSLPLHWLYVVFFLLSATGTGVAPIGYTVAKELFSAEMAGISIGAINLFPFLGGVVAQPLIGLILDKVGKIGAHYPSSAYRSVILVYIVAGLMGLVIVLFTKETLRKQ
jgi:sugar phosphate permease